MANRSRRVWLSIHRWLGLTVGLAFVLLGLTGSLLVFDHAIDEWLNSELLLTDQSGTPATVQAVIESAEHAYGREAMSLSRPRVTNGVYEVWFQAGSEQDPKFVQVLVDPYTAQVKGQRVWGEYLMTWIYRLHFRLFAGSVGGWIVGGVGVLVLISLVSGIYLWWPLWKNSWRAALGIRKGKRNYDFHKVLGSASGVLLAVIVFTGIYMEFPTVFQAALRPLCSITEPHDPSPSSSLADASRRMLSADDAIAIASEVFPEAMFDHLHPPAESKGVYEVAFRQPGEVQRSFGRSQVFLDGYSGEILEVRRPQDFTAADAFIAWQFPLHNGEAFGILGRWIVFASGFAPLMLFVTGFVMYRRRSRRADQASRSLTTRPCTSVKRKSRPE